MHVKAYVIYHIHVYIYIDIHIYIYIAIENEIKVTAVPLVCAVKLKPNGRIQTHAQLAYIAVGAYDTTPFLDYSRSE